MSRLEVLEHGRKAHQILSCAYPVIVEGQIGIAIADTDFDAIVADCENLNSVVRQGYAPLIETPKNSLKLNGKTFFRSSHVYRHG
jgi:hypothetical protein